MTETEFAQLLLSPGVMLDKNVHQIELEVAIGRFVNGHGTAAECWEHAAHFMAHMKLVYDRQRSKDTQDNN